METLQIPADRLSHSSTQRGFWGPYSRKREARLGSSVSLWASLILGIELPLDALFLGSEPEVRLSARNQELESRTGFSPGRGKIAPAIKTAFASICEPTFPMMLPRGDLPGAEDDLDPTVGLPPVGVVGAVRLGVRHLGPGRAETLGGEFHVAQPFALDEP